jgi:hypothetical protein
MTLRNPHVESSISKKSSILVAIKLTKSPMVPIFVFGTWVEGSCVKLPGNVGRENFKERNGEMHSAKKASFGYRGFHGISLWVWKASRLST